MRTRALFSLLVLFAAPSLEANVAYAQAPDDGQFIFEAAAYDINGEFILSANGVPFQSAKECNRHATYVLWHSKIEILGMGMTWHQYGDSVLIGKDGSASWFGCLPHKYYESDAYAKYVDVHMTPEKAKTMRRFPDLLH